MGLDRTVALPAGVPPWKVIVERAGLPMTVRMIDGQLALPDEQPGDGWHEVRVSVPAGMMTLRRVPAGIHLVVWGNADAALLEAVDALARALPVADASG